MSSDEKHEDELEFIEWQEKPGGEIITDSVATLWSGEVLLNGEPGGIAGPFYALETDAREWAYRKAWEQPRNRVFSAQVTSWRCAQTFVEELREEDGAAFKRLRNFWVAPVRLCSVKPIQDI